MDDSRIIKTEYSEGDAEIVHRLCHERYHCQSPAGCQETA